MPRSKRRQLVLLGPATGKSENAPLGRIREVRQTLAGYNTGPDGTAAEGAALERLHGPGMVIELPTSGDVVTQAMASLNDEAIAWPVLEKLCKTLGWRLMDVETGRVMSW
ncbi:MAG TPA: hypothetical protein VD971_01985 [Phycisphaerales bacterium]|nr:hypothetical protein [Phycisphaerales bacterium]